MDYWKDIPDLKINGARDWLNHRTLECSFTERDLALFNPFDLDNQSELQKHNAAIDEMIGSTMNIPGVVVRYDNMNSIIKGNSKIYSQEYKYAYDRKYYYKMFGQMTNGCYVDAYFKAHLNHNQIKEYFNSRSVIAFKDGIRRRYINRVDVREVVSVDVLSEDEYYTALDLIQDY